MPKELYLFIGTILGALVSLLTVMINNRSQLKLARANHEHQYRIETQKLEYEQQKESFEWLREKLEEAEQIILKIGMQNSVTVSDITREIGVSIVEWNAQYLKLDEDVCRLQMMADLYFPKLHDAVRELRGSMNVFWGTQRHLLYVETEAFIADHREDIEREKSFKEDAHMLALREIWKISDEIGAKVWAVRDGLLQVARSLIQPT
jgi:uncharacterized membrane protein YgaE (UPF0421/DUF939 family)